MKYQTEFWYSFLLEAVEASQCYFFENRLIKLQMSTFPEGAAIYFKTWKSTFVGHLGLQSMSYRVGTPCTFARMIPS